MWEKHGSYAQEMLSLPSVVRAQYTNLTHRQTDRQTDQ